MLEKKVAARFQTCEEALAFLTGMVIPDFEDMPANPKPKSKGDKTKDQGHKTDKGSSKDVDGDKAEKKGCLGFLFKGKKAEKAPESKPKDESKPKKK